MRVSTRSLYQGMQPRIQKLTEDLKNINEKIASGKQINRPSDNPIGLVDAMGLKTTLSQLEQYQRNIDYGMSWLNHREAALSEIGGLIDRAYEISVQTANDTQSAESRANVAAEVGQLLDQTIDLANTDVGGNYIFAGYRTKTTPFSKTVVGGIETAEYLGDTNDFQIQIGKDETLTIGRNGQNTVMDSNVFTALGTLKKALEDNDVATIRQQMSELKSAADALDNQVADTGAKANRLETRAQVVSSLTLSVKERLSDVEDSDLAEMVIELKQRETAYQAALATAARLQAISILNYL